MATPISSSWKNPLPTLREPSGQAFAQILQSITRFTWRLPWGLVGSVEVDDLVQVATGTAANVSGVSVAFQAYAGRHYRITYTVHQYDDAGYGQIWHGVRVDGSILRGNGYGESARASAAATTTFVCFYDATVTQRVTAQARCQSTLATGTNRIWSTTERPIVLTVEDIGGDASRG